MKEHSFTDKKLGKLIWVPEGMYYRFEPKKLPLEYTPSSKVIQQMQKTFLALGGLRALTLRFSETEVRLMRLPFMIKEAQLSSEIEGTRSTLTDVYKGRKIEEKDEEKRLDNEEIENYEKALNYALNGEKKEITEEWLKDIHRILLRGVRGSNKEPGNYKEKQNAVGDREDTLDTAKFVPASPESTPELMSNLVEFISSDSYDSLYKIAMTHYQFETIHPFRDGNGRLGRLLIVLQICREGIMPHPLLYISEFFNRNRSDYIERLFNVSSRGEIEEWILFFLKALEYQANQSLSLLDKLQQYKTSLHNEINNYSQSPNIHSFVDYLFKEPFFTIKEVMEVLKVTQPGAWIVLRKLKEHKIIEEVGTFERKKVYKAYKILRIIEGKKIED
jgi:Fic family protein